MGNDIFFFTDSFFNEESGYPFSLVSGQGDNDLILFIFLHSTNAVKHLTLMSYIFESPCNFLFIVDVRESFENSGHFTTVTLLNTNI